MITKIVSGGQTGVDRAALDVALALGLPCGGWCPKHRRAEDGRIPANYPLIENNSTNYANRTALNVKDSEGTLILTAASLSGGTSLTRDLAMRYGKPVLVVDLRLLPDFEQVEQWIADNRIRVLNVAGPRESSQPGIHGRATAYLQSLLSRSAFSAPKRTRRKRVKPPES